MQTGLVVEGLQLVLGFGSVLLGAGMCLGLRLRLDLSLRQGGVRDRDRSLGDVGVSSG